MHRACIVHAPRQVATIAYRQQHEIGNGPSLGQENHCFYSVFEELWKHIHDYAIARLEPKGSTRYYVAPVNSRFSMFSDMPEYNFIFRRGVSLHCLKGSSVGGMRAKFEEVGESSGKFEKVREVKKV